PSRRIYVLFFVLFSASICMLAGIYCLSLHDALPILGGGNLCQKGLGGGHGDFGAGVGIQRGVGFAWDGSTLGIADRDDLRTLLAGVAHGHEGVHGLA